MSKTNWEYCITIVLRRGVRMADCISGLLYIASIGVSCSFFVENYIVTLIPEQNKISIDKLKNWCNQSYNDEEFEWLSGVTSDNRPIYLARRSQGGYTLGTGIHIGAVNFHCPIIIVNHELSNENHNGFFGIEFIGDDINLIYPPDKALNYTIKPPAINYNNPENYTDKYNIDLNNECFRLIKTIDVHNRINIGTIVNLPQNIQSKLRLEFDEEKSFQDLLKYYRYVSNLLTFLKRISNNEFEVKLLTRNNIEGKTYYKDFAEVSFYKGDSTNDSERLTVRDVLKIDDLGDNIVSLFELLNRDQTAPNLLFLPNSVNDRNIIKYGQIIDICSAIEVEYKNGRQPKENDKLKHEAINLAKNLINCVNSSGVEDKLKNKAISIIGSTIKNFSPSLKDKIRFLYGLYKDELNNICKMHHWLTEYSEKDFYSRIKLFTEMRHSIAHQKMSWNDGQDIYTHIILLIYFSIFNRAGISSDIAQKCISNGFHNIF